VRIAVSAIMVFCAGALVATSSPASASSAPVYTYARHYVDGQVTHYTYTEDNNGTAVTAVARLRSYIHDGIGGERVKWISLTSDGQDLSAQAKAFPAYNLSLDPNDPNGLALPPTQPAAPLQGPVDDLLTFYVGLSDHVGIGQLHQPGDSFVDPTLLAGNFANATTPVGQDLIQLTTTLTSLTERQATFSSSYQPPPQGGLQLTAPFMSSPVCGSVPNNFELVQTAGTQFVALWGCESFTVTTTVDRYSGQIISVQMTNPLQLDGMLCQDEALTQCTPIPPSTIQRTIQLIRD